MRGLKPSRAWLLLVVASSIFACADDDAETPNDQPDSGPSSGLDAGSDASDVTGNRGDAQADASVAPPTDAAQAPTLQSCIERPNELPRPPTGELPCELLPPGFTR